MLLISFGFYAYQIIYTPNFLVGKEDRMIVIPNDADFKTVQKILHEGDYVQDLMSFAFLSRMMDYDKKVKPGRFILKANMTNLQAIRLLRLGKQEPVRITFNNVRLLKDLAEKITTNLSMRPDEFEAAAVKFSMNNKYGFNKDNLMCMFIPNTYEVYYNILPDALMERMYDEYVIFWNDERKAKAAQLGLSPVEVSILASIVQAEAMKQDEAPVIAGLYLNRLKQDMPLQADPTLVFASGDFSLKRVLNEHKEIDSPYNTYKYAGLPPGPINMPRVNCVDAVLNHDVNNYLYMCAKEDFSGYHNFTDNYRQQINNAKRYQRALEIEIEKGKQLRRAGAKK
ncbi:endolytic transglycosylase MltG [Chryseotalea sanaruensis]|uniref:Endolytic murein transglycosylase n=2 Tax=Chryseotalea sanaruensis TaxID=2482724 RepID=A0A401U7H0_9BACT|nr:endolytic transglycosylase MltG [Chryseotalea sanaruensis]